MPSGRVLGAASLSLALLLSSLANAEDGRRAPSDFRRSALIETDAPLQGGEAYAVTLEPDAIQALGEGGELRLFDAKGSEVPSLVHSAVSRQERVKRPVEIYNPVWEAASAGVVQSMTLRLSERLAAPVNEFEFEFAQDRYNASVLVEAGEDGKSWRILRDGLYLIRHSVPGESIHYAHDTLRVPSARYRHYRFTLTLPGRDRPLELKSLRVSDVASRGASTSIPVRVKAWRNERDSNSRHHYWKLDLERADLGVDRLRLELDGSDYARGSQLFEWNEKLERPGRRLAKNVIFHYGAERQDELRGFETNARRLVLMIDQGDDRPVALVAAKGSRPRQQLRFLAEASLEPPLALYFDPERARTPQYDLSRTLRERGVEEFGPLRHAPLAAHAGFSEAPEPLSERVPYLLYAVVGLLVVGLGSYIARMLRAGLPPESAPPTDEP